MMKISKVKGYYFVSFLASIIIFCIALALSGVYPFGNNTIIHGDLNNQYLALFTYLRQTLLSGNLHGIFYSTSMNLGSGFFGVMTYYLMNPLNLLVVFFKAKDLPIFIELLTVVKIGLAAVSMTFFMKNSDILKKSGIDQRLMVIGVPMSALYANMLFVFNYKECVMWLDGIIMLPLVLVGIERIVIHHKSVKYIVALTLTIFFNYYIGVIVGIAAGFTYLFVVALTWNNTNFKEKIKSFELFFGGSIISALLSAVILVPSFLSTNGIAQNHSFGFRPIYNPIYLISAALNGNVSGDVPAIFVGLVPVFLCILFFLLKQIPLQKRLIAFVSFIFLFASTCLDVTYLIWHVFTWPNGFPQRESFVLSFYIITLATYTLSYIVSKKIFVIKSSLCGLMILAFILLGLHVVIGFSAKRVAAYSVLLIVVVGIFAMLTSSKTQVNRWTLVALSLIMVGDLLTADTVVQKSQNIGSSKFNSYVKYYESVHGVVNKIQNKDQNFYRIGNLFQITNNDPILFNYNGVSNYLSQQSTQLTNFMSALGYYQNHTYDRWSNYNSGSTKSMDEFFGIKYVIGNKNKSFSNDILKINDITSGIQTKHVNNYDSQTSDKKFQIYKFNSVFPLVFKTSAKVNNIQFNFNTFQNPFILQNRFFNSIESRGQSIFVNQNVLETSQNAYTFVSTHSGQAYLYFPTDKNSDYNGARIYANGKLVSNIFEGTGENGQNENGIISLGKVEKNKRIKIEVKHVTNKVIGRQNISRKPFISVENQHNFKQLLYTVKQDTNIEKIMVRNQKIIIVTNKSFSGGNLMTTLPFENGWHASVKSKNVRIVKSFGALMSINAPKGKHKVILKYRTPGLNFGILVSVITLSITMLIKYIKERQSYEK